MTRSKLLILPLLAIWGCGAEQAARLTGSERQCPDSSLTRSLAVLPGSVPRGGNLTIEIGWEVREVLPAPARATLSLGPAYEIEVMLDLALDPAGVDFTYAVELVNPFGLGAPAGHVAVLALAPPPSGCTQAVTAATSFQLE